VVGFDLGPVLTLCLFEGLSEGLAGFLISVQISTCGTPGTEMYYYYYYYYIDVYLPLGLADVKFLRKKQHLYSSL
jgi:hypothetical protein